jgi:hypothetical protein
MGSPSPPESLRVLCGMVRHGFLWILESPLCLYQSIRVELARPQNFIELISGEPPTIVVGDFNKVFIHSHASDSKTWNLPSVAAAQMGGILKFVKLGTGTMTIDAADADTIDDSAAGGTIYCSDSGIATISLQLVGASKWVVVAATNVWTTT